jgi:hypothetical protein
MTPFLKEILLQLKDSLEFAENCSKLRDHNVFNPLNEPSKLSNFASGPVSFIYFSYFAMFLIF